MNYLVWKIKLNHDLMQLNGSQHLEKNLNLTKVMLAKSIQDCFHCRSLFHRRTVLAGRFRQVCDEN